jgi:hypothetical protein
MSYYAAQIQEELDAVQRAKEITINSDFSISERGGSYTAATDFPNNDDSYTHDRWLLLSDGNDVVDVVRDGGGWNRATVQTANKQFGFMQTLEWADAHHYLREKVSIQIRARSATITKVRAAVLSWKGAVDAITSDPVAAWPAAGVEPAWAANWEREGEILDLNLGAAFANATLDGITIDAPGAVQFGIVLWVDDTVIGVGEILEIEHISMVGSPRYPAHRPVVDEATEYLRCARFFNRHNSEIRQGFQIYANAIQHWLQAPIPMRLSTPAVTISSNPTSGNTFLSFSPNAYWHTFSSFDSIAIARSGRIQYIVTTHYTGGNGAGIAIGTFLRTLYLDAEL